MEKMMAEDRASQALGIELLEVGAGRATTRMVVRDDMVNGHMTAHGGLLFALADTAFACACNSFGPVAVAASAEITFVSPALPGDVLTAEAVLRTPFGRNGIYDVTIRREDAVIAEFRGRSHQLSSRPGSAAQGLASTGPQVVAPAQDTGSQSPSGSHVGKRTLHGPQDQQD